MHKMVLTGVLAIAGSWVAMYGIKSTEVSETDGVRPPAVAGTFYPADPQTLAQMVRELTQGDAAAPKPAGRLIALISPHAGYPYSGPVAGQGYSLLEAGQFERVIVISPTHVEAFRNTSIFKGRAYETPLGTIPVDVEFCRKLAAESKTIVLSEAGHRSQSSQRGEHALEVQLPFLQQRLGAFQLVPIVMGDQSFENCLELAKALAKHVVPGRDLIVASSDLSHFHTYDEAEALDRKVVRAVERWDYMGLAYNLERRTAEACGGGPILVAMMAAERLGANHAVVLRYANSGDIPHGDRSRVVGYLSAALLRDEAHPGLDLEVPSLAETDQTFLLNTARQAVAAVVQSGKKGAFQPTVPAQLRDDAAVFVTLKEKGRLRGCVGTIVATESLPEAVATAAANAAVHDRRFPAVSPAELDDLEYEISVLSTFRRIQKIEQIIPGRHGLLIERGRYRGLLLPQVATENGWDRETFLENTCLKAGLPRKTWKESDVDIYAFSALVFGEKQNEQ